MEVSAGWRARALLEAVRRAPGRMWMAKGGMRGGKGLQASSALTVTF